MRVSPRDLHGVSIGIEFALSVLVGFGCGYWLDKRFGTSPLLMLCGLALGFAAGFRSIMDFARRSARREEREARREAEEKKRENERLSRSISKPLSKPDASAPSNPDD